MIEFLGPGVSVFVVILGILLTLGLIVFFVERSFDKKEHEPTELDWDGFVDDMTNRMADEIRIAEDERIKKQIKAVFKKRPKKTKRKKK